MWRRASAVTVLLMASCQQAAVAVSPSPSPSAVAACRLPVGVMGGLSGFVRYPGGDFTPDPASDPSQSTFRGSNGSSIGFGPAYDAVEARWLPVPRPLVSPDGKTYAYAELLFDQTAVNGPPAPLGTRIHVVDVASTADRVVLDSRVLWSAVAYSGGHVYLIHACIECGAGDGGLWTVDASTGGLQQVVAPDASNQVIWTVVGPDAAWATDPDGGLMRLDLNTKAESTWFRVPLKALRPIGLDSRGLPVVVGNAENQVAGSTGGGAWLVRAPGNAVPIVPDDLMVEDAAGDVHGIWLLSFENVYLWTPLGHLELVGSGPTSNESLAGPCIG